MRDSKYQPNPQMDTERTRRAIRRKLNPTLTDSMRRVLVDLAAGREARHSMGAGRSAAGGFERVLAALYKRKLIDWQGRYVITDAGRAALGVAIPEGGQR